MEGHLTSFTGSVGLGKSQSVVHHTQTQDGYLVQLPRTACVLSSSVLWPASENSYRFLFLSPCRQPSPQLLLPPLPRSKLPGHVDTHGENTVRSAIPAFSTTQICCEQKRNAGTLPQGQPLHCCLRLCQAWLEPSITLRTLTVASSGSTSGFKNKKNQGHNLLEALPRPDHSCSASTIPATPFTPMNRKACSFWR